MRTGRSSCDARWRTLSIPELPARFASVREANLLRKTKPLILSESGAFILVIAPVKRPRRGEAPIT